ncbi:MAG: hypothetical protein ABSC19_11990 [Syntrophorhabdales bacterium]|jgi:hypothetical protein
MTGPGGLSDAELLYRLRIDYLEALRSRDYIRIEKTIVPQFWERFAAYYHQYENSWKDLSVSRLSVNVVIDPVEKRRAELGWMEQVLKGQIDLVP